MRETRIEDLLDYEKIMYLTAQNGLKNQVIRKTDFYDRDNLLVCGICGKGRQMIRELSVPSQEDENRKIYLKTICDCECDKKRKEIEEEQRKQAKRQRIIESRRLNSMMDSRYYNANFDEYDNPNDDCYKKIKRYAESFDKLIKGELKFNVKGELISLPKNKGLILLGDVGTGKTYSAACIANKLMNDGKKVIMVSFSKILEMIQMDADAEKDISRKIIDSDLVVFDDLGAERNTSYASEKVFNFIDARYKTEKPMIITTNLTMDEMVRTTDITYKRIYDRILEVCNPITFKGKSKRRIKAIDEMALIDQFLNGD